MPLRFNQTRTALKIRVHASLQSLRRQDWAEDADDALSVFEFLCSATAEGVYTLDDDLCSALRERHTSKPALMLRLMMVWALRHDGRVDEALAAADDILDDIEGSDRITELDQSATWTVWLSTIPAAKQRPRSRAGNVDAGWALAMTLRRGDVRPEQIDTIMAAFNEDAQSVVAANVAMAAALLGVSILH